MTKETVRYPDALAARIETFVTDSSAFESKSEYHRFASDFLLSLLDAEHDPSVLGYSEIFGDLESDLDTTLDHDDGPDERFLETYVRVRRHLLRGDLNEARAIVDEAYDVTDREALLLEEVIAQARTTEMAAAVDASAHASPGEQKRESNGQRQTDGVESMEPAQEEKTNTRDTGRSDGESTVIPANEPPVESEHRPSHHTTDGER